MAKVLIVDDDRSSRAVMVENLLSQGYTVFEAADGQRALEIAYRETPDLVLSDWMMPRMEGIELCSQLKADARTQWTYFILVTARSASEDRVRGLDAGADDFLSKPVETNELYARVRTGLRVQAMQSELSTQNHLLSRLNRFKSDMLAFASHEIKTPLAVLRISLELLRLETQLGEQVELLDTAEQQAIQLSDLVANLLNLRKLEEGHMEFDLQPTDLHELIDKVVEQMNPLARLRRQYIGINQTPVRILADRDKLQQVLINLLSNACKYSPEGSRILVQIHCGPSDVLIGIIDEGSGIAEDKQHYLFQRYTQLQEGEGFINERLRGTGLGLVLCQEFIQGMGGSIGVHSKQSRGSCFWVQMPQYIPSISVVETPSLTPLSS